MRLVDLAGVFRGTEALAAGIVTTEQLRGPGVRRLFRDVYLPAGMRFTHQMRCEGAALVAPPEAVLTGRSAATVLGVELAQPTDPVEFVVDERYRFGPIRGITVKRTILTGADWRDWDGIRVASPARLGLDLAARADLRGAVADLDEMLRAGQLDHAELKGRLLRCHEHGVVRARQAVDLARSAGAVAAGVGAEGGATSGRFAPGASGAGLGLVRSGVLARSGLPRMARWCCL
jgi:hypothetical protein